MGTEASFSSGDLARATGCTLRAIRFYEEQGLLRPADVSEGGHRRYTQADLDRLRLIADLRELGLPIPEIRSALELKNGSGGGVELAQRFEQLLRDHIGQAELRLQRLRRLKKELQAALDTIQKRLSCRESDCPCDAGERSDTAPRIVKLVAQGGMCVPRPAPGELDAGRSACGSGDGAGDGERR